MIDSIQRRIAAILLGLLVPACAPSTGTVSTQNPASAGKSAPARADRVVEVSPIVVSPYSEAELAAQFERAREKLLEGAYTEAAEDFDRLVRLAPDGQVTAPSLYNAAVAREALGEREEAAARLRELLRRYPGHALERSAELRLGRVLAYLERWSELVGVADRLLARTDLAVLQVIEARGARALGLAEQDQVEEAAREVVVAQDLVEQNRLGEAGKPPLELAQLSFALGEVRRLRSERIKFVPVPANFADALEKRCQGLLDAQQAYTDAMRSLDAHWSAMAGYRIGQMYQELHRDVMMAPPPAAADSLRKKQLFEGAMRLRYRVLLEKGLKIMDGVTRLGERTGESSAWVLRAREAERALSLSLEDERTALAKLPFTEDELREALEALKKKP
jgi:tetratricopeptide (TPR) repeat protein